jgi:CRP-like cAMP-binding protein
VACNVLHDAAQRLARWLLMTEDRIGPGPLELTQEYLSIMTGVQRTTISVIAAGFRADGLIGYKRLDRLGLERQACECYRVILERSEELAGG